jgi:choline kinase
MVVNLLSVRAGNMVHRTINGQFITFFMPKYYKTDNFKSFYIPKAYMNRQLSVFLYQRIT